MDHASTENQKILIVTGGSRGIGAATARLAASRGYSVCVNYLRDESAAASVVCDIQARGGKSIAVRADISVESDVAGLFETTHRELGPVTDLVNNAATLETQMRLDEMDAADRVQKAMETVYAERKTLTRDVGGTAGTSQFSEAVLAAMG